MVFMGAATSENQIAAANGTNYKFGDVYKSLLHAAEEKSVFRNELVLEWAHTVGIQRDSGKITYSQVEIDRLAERASGLPDRDMPEYMVKRLQTFR